MTRKNPTELCPTVIDQIDAADRHVLRRCGSGVDVETMGASDLRRAFWLVHVGALATDNALGVVSLHLTTGGRAALKALSKDRP